MLVKSRKSVLRSDGIWIQEGIGHSISRCKDDFVEVFDFAAVFELDGSSISG